MTANFKICQTFSGENSERDTLIKWMNTFSHLKTGYSQGSQEKNKRMLPYAPKLQLSDVSKLKGLLKQNLKASSMPDKLMCLVMMSHRNDSKGLEGFKVNITDT